MTVLPLRPTTGAHRAVARPGADGLPSRRARGAAQAAAATVLEPSATPAPPARRGVHERLEAALGAQYKVVRALGAGGYGEVFLVRDLMLHRVVAVKVLRETLAEDPKERERFRREARTVAHLAHPGIVPVLAYGETDDGDGGTDEAPLCWTMMPCASGGSLATRLTFNGRMTPAAVVTMLVSLCDALSHAHRHGVVHCDLKPDNVLFAAGDDRPLLTDFGIAARPHHDRGIGAGTDVGGTPAWMAPEQRLGVGALDARSDVYALGMLGWVMLAGRLPERTISGRPDRRSMPADVPAPLVEVLLRALQREPAHRWETAAQMAAALERSAWPAWRRRLAESRDAVRAVVRATRRVVARLRVA